MGTKTLSLAGAVVAGLLAVTGLQASAQASEFRQDAIRFDDHHWWWRDHFRFDFFRFDHHRDHDRRWW